MVRRQFPRPKQVFELMRFKSPTWSPTTRRLRSALTVEDLRTIARRRTPQGAFDYTDGAAEDEITLARARQAFRDIEFHPAILRDVSTVDTGWEVLGAPVALPFGIAPTGFTRLMHTEGEEAGAAAAAAAGIPFALSTLGTTSVERVAKGRPGRPALVPALHVEGPRPLDGAGRARGEGRVRHAACHRRRASGRRAAARQAQRLHDSAGADRAHSPQRHPAPSVVVQLSHHRTAAVRVAESWKGTVAELLDTMFDPTVSYDDLRWIKDQWPGKLVVKGVQTVEDAKRLADLGVDGITLSNHGGRQLDRSPVPFHLLPEVVREVGGDTEIHLDTGIMSGADVVAAVALGARFTMIGRAYLYGLMAGGRRGVDRAIEILRDQVVRTMKLLGATSLEELNPRHVTQLRRFVPFDR